MADLRIDIASEFTGKKAFDKAEKATFSLNKTVMGLAKSFGPAALGAAVLKFGKDAAEAFIEDQKQAAKLANVVKNLGLGFQNSGIADYIDKLTIASGVSDSKLRPAFQALLTTTGDVTKSQELLSQAIDISAGSGVELETVSQDLANGYLGITKGLKKYNLGLTAAELKSAKFVDIQKKLIDTYKGSNAAYLDTYAGKMQVLTNAAGEAQEVIGGALIKALMDFTGAIDAADLATKIGSWSQAIATFIDDYTWAMKKLWFITSDKALLSALNPFSNYVEKGLAKIDAERAASEWRSAMAGALGYDPKNNSLTGFKLDQAAKDKAARDAARRAKELAAAQDKQTKELKKQAALKKAGTVFDMEQIQLVAALKGKLSEDDRKRAEAQLAILNGNDELATKLTKQILMAQDETGNLYKYFLTIGNADIKNPFAFLDTWIVEFQKKLDGLKMPNFAAVAPTSGIVQGFTPSTVYPAGKSPGDPGFIGPVIPSTNVGSTGGPVSNFIPDTSIYGAPGANTQGPIALTISGDSALTKAIADSLQVQSLSGIPSSIQRLVSTFG